MKWLGGGGREADRSASPSATVKNEWNHTSTTPAMRLQDVHTDSFAVYSVAEDKGRQL